MATSASVKTAVRKTGAGFAQATAKLIARFRSQRPMRTGSLVITLFGDAIAPHGGTVWLGSLIRALAGFGVNQRLVRTSVYRLVQDGWLASEQIGRRSYYSLTEAGRRRFEEASRRIYGEPRQDWSGDWCLLLLTGLEAAERDALRKSLGWLGFAGFSTNVMAHPAPDMTAVTAELESAGCGERVLMLDARVANGSGNSYLERLVQEAWSLDRLAARYTGFLEQFRPVYRQARQARSLDPELAFRVRTLLIHEYRKVLLRDPLLPEALLPGGWEGVAAYQLCRNLYTQVAAPAETYLTRHMETADGPLPPAEPAFQQRFGGLTAAADRQETAAR